MLILFLLSLMNFCSLFSREGDAVVLVFVCLFLFAFLCRVRYLIVMVFGFLISMLLNFRFFFLNIFRFIALSTLSFFYIFLILLFSFYLFSYYVLFSFLVIPKNSSFNLRLRSNREHEANDRADDSPSYRRR